MVAGERHLHCRVHNALAAEEDFGRHVVALSRASSVPASAGTMAQHRSEFEQRELSVHEPWTRAPVVRQEVPVRTQRQLVRSAKLLQYYER
jgi:hypothetical protein